MEVRVKTSNCSTSVIYGSAKRLKERKKETSQRKVLLRGGWVKSRWGEMNKEHGHRCLDKLFIAFFIAVLPAAFSSACH